MVSASADGGGVVAKDKRGIAQEYGARAERDIGKGLDISGVGRFSMPPS